MGLAHSRAVLFSRDARVRARRTEPIGRGVYVTCTIVYGVASLAQRALQVFQALRSHSPNRSPFPVSRVPFPVSRVPHPDSDSPMVRSSRWIDGPANARPRHHPPPPSSSLEARARGSCGGPR